MSIKLSRRSALAGLTSAGMITACGPVSPTYDADIIVVGAGLSGLHAANILSEAGRDVLVLEGSNRIGGRANTLDFGEYGVTEGGGEQVGAGYARIRDVAHRLNIPVIRDETPPLGTAIHFRDKLVALSDWPQLPENPFPDTMKTMSPASGLVRLAFKENPLADVSAWHGQAGKSADIAAKEWLSDRGLSEAAVASMDISLNANSLETYSMLNLFRSLTLFAQDNSLGQSGSIEGGISRLPNAMANQLPRPVLINEPVSEITVTDQDARISSQSGKTWRAKHVIAALPFPVLRNIKINAPTTPLQREAIARLPYTQIMQIHFYSDNKFWEKDGYAPSMWTDGPLERIFADKGKDGKPTGLFKTWINGTGATALDALTDSELSDMCKKELHRLRPSIDDHIHILKVVRWTKSNPLAGGAYMHFAPGQIHRWAGQMGAPAGRLSFAGEHLSMLHTGLEGAMESGEHAALNLLDL